MNFLIGAPKRVKEAAPCGLGYRYRMLHKNSTLPEIVTCYLRNKSDVLTCFVQPQNLAEMPLKSALEKYNM